MTDPGSAAQPYFNQALASSSAAGTEVAVDSNVANSWDTAYTMDQETDSLQWLAFNPPPTYRTPESSLQHAITPPANAAPHTETTSGHVSSAQPIEQPGSRSLVNTQQMPTTQPPVDVPPTRSGPTLFSTAPLSFSRPPEVAGSTNADPNIVDASKTVRLFSFLSMVSSTSSRAF